MVTHPSIVQLSKRLWPCGVGVGLASLAVYLLTVARCAFPGESAALIVRALGLGEPSGADHPLFAWTARLLAGGDLASVAYHLNLFSAVCGACCVALLYGLVGKAILFFACEDAGGGGRLTSDPEDSSLAEDVPEIPPEVQQDNEKKARIATRCGLAASLVFATTLPVWMASTRLQREMFDLLLTLAAYSLVPCYFSRLKMTRLAASAFLLGLAVLESPVSLLTVPVYAVVVFFLLVNTSRRTLGTLALFAAIGLAFCAVLWLYGRNLVGAPASHGLGYVLQYLHELAQHHYLELKAHLPGQGWLLQALQVAFPALVLLFGRGTLFRQRNISTAIAVAVLAVCVVPTLLNLAIAPLSLCAKSGCLPVFSAALSAAAVGFLFAAAWVWGSFGEEAAESEQNKSLRAAQLREGRARTFSAVVAVVVAVLSLCAPWISGRAIENRRADFADAAAREVVLSMGERTCLVSDGCLDSHLRLQAFLLRRPLTLISLRSPPSAFEAGQLRDFIGSSPFFETLNRQRLLNAQMIGVDRFLVEWLGSDREAPRRMMVLSVPDIWLAGGYKAIPEGLAFGGAPDARGIEDVFAHSEQRISALARLLKKGDGESFRLAALRGMLRTKLSLAVNELGVLCEERGDIQGACRAYGLSLEIEDANISAAVNLYALLATSNLHPEQVDGARKRVRALLERAGAVRGMSLTNIVLTYGNIRQPGFYQQQREMWVARGAKEIARGKSGTALSLAQPGGAQGLLARASLYLQMGDEKQAQGCYAAALEVDPKCASAYSGLCTLMIRRGDAAAAEEWLRRGREAGVPKRDLTYPTIALQLLKKNSDEALRLLKAATKDSPEDLRYWTMLADELLRRGDVQEVEFRVLPDMQKALQSPNHFLVHSVRGFLLKAKGPKFAREARLAFLKALALNSGLVEMWNAVLELDLVINNPEFVESDTKNLLRVEPEHVLANYLMGAALLEKGALTQAEDFLRRSVERKPAPASCNDLAEDLRLQKKLAEAEAFARKALEMDGGLAPAMDTLANVLCDAGRAREALPLSQKAVSAQQSNMCYQQTMLRIQVETGDKEGVRQRLHLLNERKVALPPALKRAAEKLLSAV